MSTSLPFLPTFFFSYDSCSQLCCNLTLLALLPTTPLCHSMARNPEFLISQPSKPTKRTPVSDDSLQSLPFRTHNPESHLNNGAAPLRRSQEQTKSLPPILRLANEVLDLILDRIEADPSKGVNVDKRAYLSQESFNTPFETSSTEPSTGAQDLSNWRRTCRRFSELGAPHQFARVTTQFSRKDFDRLEWLAGQAHLVQHVKKFSYLVPWFYAQGAFAQFVHLDSLLTCGRT